MAVSRLPIGNDSKTTRVHRRSASDIAGRNAVSLAPASATEGLSDASAGNPSERGGRNDRHLLALATIAAIALPAACRVERLSPTTPPPPQRTEGGTASTDVWIYTSMYRHVVDAIDPLLAAALPEVKVQWYQAGSEKVMSRLDAELAAGGTQADLLATSDPFVYEKLKREDHWLPYVSPRSLRTPRQYVDEDGAYAAFRFSTMVLVARDELANPPGSWTSLVGKDTKYRLALGDPLSSGTAFSWACATYTAFGEAWFGKLRNAGARIAGGNAAVLQWVETGEADVGVVLLENALASIAKGSHLVIRWPSDGAVLIPGNVGILKQTRHAEAAKRVVDALLSPAVQRVIVEVGHMHSADPALSGPPEQPGLQELASKVLPLASSAATANGGDGTDQVKRHFAEVFSK